MRRRDLLMGGAAIVGGALLSSRNAATQSSIPNYRSRFGALGVGHPDPWKAGTLGVRPIFRILEVFLYGGLSPWETFYVNPALAGSPTCPAGCPSQTPTGGKQWGTYRCDFEALWAADEARRTALLSAEDLPKVTKEFVNGIHLGPATYPLWRSEIFDHLQVLVTSHDLTPHEAAVPLSLTGRQLGRPEMTGTGTVANRNRLSGEQPSSVPGAFVLKPERDRSADNVLAATSTGRLGSAYRPVLIDVPCGGPNLSVLSRAETPEQDRLLEYYLQQYRRRLTFAGAQAPVRSPAFADYESMLSQYRNVAAIRDTLSGFTSSPDIVGGSEVPGCGSPIVRCPTGLADGSVRQALDFAAYLLRQPQTTYVCVVDTGRHDAGGAGYDTHSAHAAITYRNLTGTLEILARLLDPSLPGPKLDDNTLVVLTTEFGRGPEREGATGRQHWPQAYVNVLIPPRGQVFTRPGKRLLGKISDSALPTDDAAGIQSITPTDLRGAMLAALGINPLAQDVFGVGDFSSPIRETPPETPAPSPAQEQTDTGVLEENNVRANLVRKVLGYEV